MLFAGHAGLGHCESCHSKTQCSVELHKCQGLTHHFNHPDQRHCPLKVFNMDSSSHGSTAFSRRLRKSRQAVIPADTVLRFAHYNPQYHVDETISRYRNRNNTNRKREQFAQANYRFAVDPHYGLGYSDCMLLPDAVVPWSVVDLVFMHHSHDCPICLHPLRCPRVTPCGHVFDFVCMVQHFSYTHHAGGFAKCPLCFSKIRIQDLRACVLRPAQQIQVGEPCTLRLISRQRGHMLAHMHPTDSHSRLPKIMSSEDPLFSRLVCADENYLLQLISESMNDLRQAKQETKQENNALSPFIETAMETLKKSKHAYRMRRATTHHRNELVGENQGHSHVEHKVQSAHSRDPWYFYQVRDCRNIFLHPVNHRCLVTEFSGDFTRMETELCGTVLQVEGYTMTERLRRRYRVLEHLPLGCEFSFVELDLSHLISERTKTAHVVELRQRSHARMRQKISAAREDRLAAKRRAEDFQEHFAIQTEGRSFDISEEVVDSRDPEIFPALCTKPSSTTEGTVTSEDNNQEMKKECTFTNSSRCHPLNAWGADVSSYSSVTSRMGIFPSLGESSAKMPSPRGFKNSSLDHEAISTDEDSRTNPNMSRDLFRSVLHSRGGRKAHGRSKILWSNHGSTCRP